MPAPALARLAQEILPLARDVDVRVLPEDQLLVRKGMVPNPQAGAGLKAAHQIPGEGGYEVYVGVRAPGAEPQVTQRVRPDEPPAAGAPPGPLRLDAEAESGEWTLPLAGGASATVRVRRGASAPLAEVNAILAAVEREVRR